MGVGMIYRRLVLSSPAFHLCGNQCQLEAVKDKRMHWRLRVNLLPCPDFSPPFPTARILLDKNFWISHHLLVLIFSGPCHLTRASNCPLKPGTPDALHAVSACTKVHMMIFKNIIITLSTRHNELVHKRTKLAVGLIVPPGKVSL